MLNISIKQENALHVRVRTFLKQGLSDEQIVDQLKGENIQRNYIESIIENVEDEKNIKRPFKHLMVLGICLITIGAIFGMMTYKVTEKWYSSHSLLLYGFILAGLIAMARAISLYRD